MARFLCYFVGTFDEKRGVWCCDIFIQEVWSLASTSTDASAASDCDLHQHTQREDA